MKKIILFFLLIFSFGALSWNLKGHVLVAQMAYENLNPTVRFQVNQLAKRVFSQLPYQQQRFMNRQFGDVSTFAKVASLPDGWRSLPLEKVYRKFNAPLDNVLSPFAEDNTSSWHFINKAYPHRYCKLVRKQNVTWAIPMLKKAFQETDNENTKAVTLVFLIHFVADAHQPLHTITGVNWICQGDAGGNAYCLKTEGGQCVLNLHALWDSALGYLWSTRNLQNAAALLQHQYPVSHFSSALSDLNPDAWVKNEYQYAPFIYSTPADQMPSAVYYEQGRKIAQRQMVLAAYRLAEILNQLYRPSQK